MAFLQIAERFGQDLRDLQKAPFANPHDAYAFCVDMGREMDAIQDMARALKPQGTVQTRCKESLMQAASSLETALYAGKKFAKSRDPDDLMVVRMATAEANDRLEQWALWRRVEADTMRCPDPRASLTPSDPLPG